VSENLIALDEIRKKGWLVLADGSVFEGEAIGVFRDGADKVATGEVVFNTAMSGYQEIITDPSYAGQIIAFTYPHIGNYGVCSRDEQARHPFCRGIIVRDLATHPSNWGAQGDLEAFLTSNNIGGLTGIDTRRLTRHVREEGAMPCAIGTISKAELLVAAKEEQGTLGRDFVSEVTTPSPYTIHGGPLRVVAYDFGIKQKMLERLSWLATVDVVPASTPAKEALDRKPDGVLLSNGPGDPAALLPIIETVRELLGQVPIFGICLGHQLLASALGAKTFKLAFGHHGANQPIRRIGTSRVEVTSENHGFAVMDDTIEYADVTHVNLNDGVIEGLSCKDAPAFSVQYHPEAGPGPHDASYLFGEFRALMEAHH
jgi:carbamoyl-phosphate synthase small subunit